jgi:hypothetical protein
MKVRIHCRHGASAFLKEERRKKVIDLDLTYKITIFSMFLFESNPLCIHNCIYDAPFGRNAV